MDGLQLGVFDIYFATLVGMALHPGYNRDNVTQPSLKQCADTAVEMIQLRSNYITDASQDADSGVK